MTSIFDQYRFVYEYSKKTKCLTLVPQGAILTKMWSIKNTGDGEWPSGCKLLFVGGELEPTVLSEHLLPVTKPSEVSSSELLFCLFSSSVDYQTRC